MRAFLLAIILAATGAALPVESITLGGVRLELGETTFAAAERLLGAVPRDSGGDAAGFRTQACYRTSGRAPTTVYLEGGEMGSGEIVTQVEVIGVASSPAGYDPPIAKRCGVLRGSPLPIRTDRGVELGMTRSELEHRLGRAGQDSAGITTYEATGTRTRKDGLQDAWSKLRVRYQRGHVTAFYALVIYTY